MARLGFRYIPVALLLAVSPATARAQHPPSAEARLRFDIAPADSTIAASMKAYAREGVALVETFFSRPFPRPVVVRVFPDGNRIDLTLLPVSVLGRGFPHDSMSILLLDKDDAVGLKLPFHVSSVTAEAPEEAGLDSDLPRERPAHAPLLKSNRASACLTSPGCG